MLHDTATGYMYEIIDMYQNITGNDWIRSE